MNIDARFTGDHEHGFNTIAEIPGTDPKLKDELVMVGGHLDSWASGNRRDRQRRRHGGRNGSDAHSQCAESEAAAHDSHRLVDGRRARRVRQPRVRQAALWHCAAVHRARPDEAAGVAAQAGGPGELKPDQQKISAYFNVDNGSGRIRGIYLEQNAAVAPIFEQWMAPLKDLGVTTITMRHTGGTDHENFDAVGIPGFQFIQDPLDYGSRTHHTNMDTYERLQPEDLAQAATVEAIFVYNAAMRDQMLPRKPLPHPETRGAGEALPDLYPTAVLSPDSK